MFLFYSLHEVLEISFISLHSLSAVKTITDPAFYIVIIKKLVVGDSNIQLHVTNHKLLIINKKSLINCKKL